MNKVYIIYGDDGRYYGYTYDKVVKNKILAERKGYKSIKLSEDEAVYYKLIPGENGSLNYNRCGYEITDYYGICMTIDEEQYMYEAFGDYKTESIIAMEKLYRYIDGLKFSDKEREELEPLISFIETTLHAYSHGMYDECECDEYEIYDYSMVAKIFVYNVLLA